MADNSAGRSVTAAFSPKHPIPTIQGYRDRLNREGAGSNQNEDTSKTDRAKAYVDEHRHGTADSTDKDKQPYQATNRNECPPEPGGDSDSPSSGGNKDAEPTEQSTESFKDTSETSAASPKEKRKQMKKQKEDGEGRQVTDPVTHLPIHIKDSTNQDLKNSPENIGPEQLKNRSGTDLSGNLNTDDVESDIDEGELSYRGMNRLFPSPNHDVTRRQMIHEFSKAMVFAGAATTTTILLFLIFLPLFIGSNRTPNMYLLVGSLVTVVFESILFWGLKGWLSNKVDGTWQTQLWTASREEEEKQATSSSPESTQWLNMVMARVWPLVNPDLFTSLADMIEDVMQASLPKAVRMISVEDIGQGSTGLRILGVKWLPPGKAGKSVNADGDEEDTEENSSGDRTLPDSKPADERPGEAVRGTDAGEKDKNSSDDSKDPDAENIAQGMEAEEGEFVNMEIAFSYRAQKSGRGIKEKAKNAHLYLAFYLPGGIKVPVWVELKGLLGIMRCRMQLCPDPPFFELVTITLLGQPKARMSCVPLAKAFLNVMDLPVLSNFVQSAIDAALNEYVAPRSLTLNLKQMISGDDFAKDTKALGAVMVKIKRSTNFKEGDSGIPLFKDGAADPYVSVGWAKFGKPMWSTRVILAEMNPVWEETAFILVGTEELNAEERIRCQLWDSDRTSADDDLGRVEVDLKQIMQDSRSKGKLWAREDRFLGMDAGEKMPGKLVWEIGYFPKTTIQPQQIQQQKAFPEIRSIGDLKKKVDKEADHKLREATHAGRDMSEEIKQAKAQDFKEKADEVISSATALDDHPTGIFSIQIHNITGLEYEQVNKNRSGHNEGDETQGNDDLPNSFCTVILNHAKIFKTRVKPANAKPFFNAGTERLTRDWQTTEVIVSVRDARSHEEDALLGLVYLPLGEIFRDRSQIDQGYPLVGGIGHGRIRISMVFRSIELQLPKELLGWEFGTVEIADPIASTDLPDEIRNLRLKAYTSLQRVKLHNKDGQWPLKHDKAIHLAVRNRYSSCLVFEFRKGSIGPDKTAAFAVLWLKDISDNEKQKVKIAVFSGQERLKRAKTCCVDDVGEQIGSLEVLLKFVPGLSSGHKKLASKNQNLRDVFDVLDTAADNDEINAGADPDNKGDSSSSDSGSISGDDGGDEGKNETDGKRGPIDQIKDYAEHRGNLHRQHRGVMQFKGARTTHWLKRKVDSGKDHVMNKLGHHERQSGIETEV